MGKTRPPYPPEFQRQMVDLVLFLYGNEVKLTVFSDAGPLGS